MAQAARVERSSDRWLSLVLSVLLHGGLFAAVAYTWWTYKNDHPAPTLAIEASVVDAKSVPGIGKLPPQPEAPPPPPQPPPEAQPQVEPEGPPQPSPEELARRVQEQKAQAEREAQEKLQAEQAKQLELDRQREEQERQQEQALAEEKAAQEKREAEQKKAALEKAEAEHKAAAEAQKRADEKRLAEEQQKADAERRADLQRSLNQEIHQDQLRDSGAVASWVSQITARITDSWVKPPSTRSGIVCVLDVTQVPGGAVTNVRIGTCNADQAVRESIETAVYKASPLPPPPDPSLFQRELIITFRPN